MDFLSLGFNIITIIITIIVLIVAIVYISKHSKSITKLEEDVSTNKKNISAIPTYTLQKLINELSEDDISTLLISFDDEKIKKGMDKMDKDKFLEFKDKHDKLHKYMDELYEKYIKEEEKEKNKDDKEKPTENNTEKPTEEEKEKPTETTEKFTLMYPANSMYIQKVNYLI